MMISLLDNFYGTKDRSKSKSAIRVLTYVVLIRSSWYFGHRWNCSRGVEGLSRPTLVLLKNEFHSGKFYTRG